MSTLGSWISELLDARLSPSPAHPVFRWQSSRKDVLPEGGGP
jgi:hypothetical protein